MLRLRKWQKIQEIMHQMCYTEGALDFWLQGIQPIEILSRIPTLSSSSVI
jgi:hypothetical protein